MNTFKTFLLMGALTVLLVLVGNLLGGQSGMIIAFGFAVLMNFGSYWFSDTIVLKMYRAKEVSSAEAPVFHRIVQELAPRAGLPLPKLYVIENAQPNAFATGRNPQRSAVAVTTGLLRLLPEEQVRGVIAHELAHIKHRDILIGTIAATIAGAISMLAQMAQWAMIFGGGRASNDDEGGNPIAMLATLIVAPIAALMIQMGISRSREFLADRGGAEISGDPLSLANALRALERKAEALPMNVNPATAHMFIVSPLHAGGLTKLFSTHPPMAERIARLEQMIYGSAPR